MAVDSENERLGAATSPIYRDTLLRCQKSNLAVAPTARPSITPSPVRKCYRGAGFLIASAEGTSRKTNTLVRQYPKMVVFRDETESEKAQTDRRPTAQDSFC